MVTERSNLFRQKALERSASPERLDQLMQVVSPKNWLPLFALGSVVASGLAWSIVGRIPITVAGQGVLVFPSKTVDFQATTSGQLQDLKIKAGDFVKKGDVIGTINQADLDKQLQQQRAKLAELELQNTDASSLQGQRSTLELRAIAQERDSLQQRLVEAQSLSPIIRDKYINSVQFEQKNLQQRLKESRELAPTLQERLDRRKALRKEGAISDDMVLEAQQTYLDSIKKISDLESQLKSLDLKQVEAEKSYRENLSQINDFRAQLKTLDTKEKTVAEGNFQSSSNRKNQIAEIKRNIAHLEFQAQGNSKILSNSTGRVLEITSAPGQMLAPGTRLGTIQAQEPTSKLVAVSYFPVAEGKKLQKGMKVQITPSSIKREQFGGIVGTVTNVSAFPVTKEGVASLVGNPDLAQSLTVQGPQIQVFMELDKDPATHSGYKWSSSTGPQIKMSPGTTTSVRVTVEEQAPITFVFPILKSWSGVY